MTFISCALRPSSILLLVSLIAFFSVRSTEGQVGVVEEVELDGDLRRDLEESLTKRQSRVGVGLNRGPNGGMTGNLDLSHTTRGGSTYTGRVDVARGGHAATLGYSRSFHNGRGRFGAHVTRDSFGRNSYGIRGGWSFKRSLKE